MIEYKYNTDYMIIMSIDEPFRCSLCNDVEFNSREELDKHNREKHPTASL
jgi:hypothetical protein